MDISRIRLIDKSDMLTLLTSFPDQYAKGREIGETSDFSIDLDIPIDSIVFAGMGGSAISGDLVIACTEDNLELPMVVSRDYDLPAFVSDTTLVYILSYSGNTEESLSAYEKARERNASMVCVTSGGKIDALARRDNVPVFKIPGGQPPRTALAYLMLPILISLSRLGLIEEMTVDLDEAYELLLRLSRAYHPEKRNNLALEVASKLAHKIPIIYSATQTMKTVSMRWKCQFNENAKIHSFFNVFPEMNHNEIVGYDQLPEIFQNFQVIYLQDIDDNCRIENRMDVTEEILKRQYMSVLRFHTEGRSKLARLFSLIYLGDMVSYYLAIQNGVDPTPIENINILKQELEKII